MVAEERPRDRTCRGGRAVGERTQADTWALGPAAARQFHASEGHLRIARKHIEQVGTEAGLVGRQGGTDGAVVVERGTWLDNVRKRGGKLAEQRWVDLDRLGMRW